MRHEISYEILCPIFLFQNFVKFLVQNIFLIIMMFNYFISLIIQPQHMQHLLEIKQFSDNILLHKIFTQQNFATNFGTKKIRTENVTEHFPKQ